MGSKISNHVIPKKDIIEEDEVDVCPICYDPLTENNSECVQKWNCSHRFHTKCIQNWNNVIDKLNKNKNKKLTCIIVI